jgi:hypothetical protein
MFCWGIIYNILFLMKLREPKNIYPLLNINETIKADSYLP